MPEYEDITQEFETLLVHRDPESEGTLMVRNGVLVVRYSTIQEALNGGVLTQIPDELQWLSAMLRFGGAALALTAASLWLLFR